MSCPSTQRTDGCREIGQPVRRPMLKRSVISHAGALLCLLALAAPAAAATGPDGALEARLRAASTSISGGPPARASSVSNMSGEDIALGGLASAAPTLGISASPTMAAPSRPSGAFSSCSLEVEFQPGTSGRQGGHPRNPGRRIHARSRPVGNRHDGEPLIQPRSAAFRTDPLHTSGRPRRRRTERGSNS